MRIMRPRAINTHVTLQTDVPASLPKLRGDERRLKQILINLLSNAVKFSQQGGVVRVAVRFEEDASLAIEVSDDGIGIAKEHLDRIFEPFAQVDSTISRRHDGTGLGLPLTRALTECHGGTLTIESQPQEGTTVTVRLPAERILANEAA
jgi:signal transduction histidine kinase